MMDGYSYLEDVLAQVRANRADAARYWLALHLLRALAVLTFQPDVRRQLTVQLHIVNDNLEHLRLADAEIHARLPLRHGSFFPPRR